MVFNSQQEVEGECESTKLPGQAKPQTHTHAEGRVPHVWQEDSTAKWAAVMKHLSQ